MTLPNWVDHWWRWMVANADEWWLRRELSRHDLPEYERKLYQSEIDRREASQ